MNQYELGLANYAACYANVTVYYAYILYHPGFSHAVTFKILMKMPNFVLEGH